VLSQPDWVRGGGSSTLFLAEQVRGGR